MNKSISLFIVACVCIFFTACIKDTDFDQIDDIVGAPIVELNLIHFDLPASDFFDSINSVPILTLSDTTRLSFLDDKALKENLKKAEFLFKFTNSIPRSFQVHFQFLSEFNDTMYVSQTQIPSGTLSSPTKKEFIDVVEEDAILQLTQAEKVVVTVNIASSSANLHGSLNMKSKATYFLEY